MADLTPYRAKASKYADTLAAQRAINRSREAFPGCRFAKIDRGSRYYIRVMHEDICGFLLEEPGVG